MENIENIDYNDDTTYSEYQPDGGPILYPVPSYWIEVEGIFPTVEGGTTFYPHFVYYVPVYGYETPYDTVDYGYLVSADPDQYENDNMLYEHDSADSAQSDEDFPGLATDTYHTLGIPESYLEPEATTVGNEDMQSSDTDSSSSTSGSYYIEDRESELRSTGTASNILKTSYKQIECNDFDSNILNNSVAENFESSLNFNYESSNENEEFACKDSGSICKEMSSDDISLEEENNRVTKTSDCSSKCIYVSSKVNDNFVVQGSDEMNDKNTIVSHNDNIFEKKDLKDPLDNSKSCYQSKFTESENSEDSNDKLDYGDIMSSNISNTDHLQKNIVKSFVLPETKLKNDITSSHGIKDCSGDHVNEKNDIKKHRVRFSSECKSSNDSGEINYEYDIFSTKTIELDSESTKWEYQGMKKFNSLDDLSDTKSIKEYNTLQDLSKTRSLRKEQGSSRSDDDEKYEVQLLENDIDYESVETRADEYGEKNCLSPPDCIEFTDEEVKYLKDQLYLTALSGKLYKKTQIPPVEVLPVIYEDGEEPLCEDDDESRTFYKEIEEELCEDNGESPANYEEVEKELCEDNGESPTIYEEVLEQLCEDNDESLELQTSGVGEPEGALTCSPDLSKSVKQQKPKGKRMKNIRKFFSRIFCCVKPP